MKSVMNHNFSTIPSTNVRRSTFDRSHGLKTAFDSGYLIPLEVQEVLPGDDVVYDSEFFARLPATVCPPMDNVFFDTQAFFVPSRLVWNNFTKFMGERVNPGDSIDYTIPTMTFSDGVEEDSLADYMGIPTKVAGISVNALPFRAYHKIWDDWYRDENLQDSHISGSFMLDDADSSPVFRELCKRGKRHDYFTSALPWTQKGDALSIPITGQAPVMYGDKAGNYAGLTCDQVPNGAAKDTPVVAYGATGNAELRMVNTNGAIRGFSNSAGATAYLYADLSNSSAATINSLRMAFQLQVLFEQQARGGTRYIEILRSCFGTISPDARLQRSEYLGGSSDVIRFSPIAQTSSTPDETTPTGNLVAQGAVRSSLHFRKAFTEHGYLIILGSVRCDLNYQNGLNRMWSRRTRYDFFWPALQHLGEQAVLNKEIYCQGPNATDRDGNIVDDQPFGYQERYAEYRYAPSLITGRLRSNATQSLDVWHFAQDFTSLPMLNANFIEENPPLKRVLAVQNQPEVILDCYHRTKWTRPLDVYSVPGLIDHL